MTIDEFIESVHHGGDEVRVNTPALAGGGGA